MSTDRPEPDALRHGGPPVVPRPAATVILVCDGEAGLEVLLVERNRQASFMGGAWVFPGGSVEPDDGEGQEALQRAARRELAEEAGISLAPEATLIPFSRWITPEANKTRFDTWFYLAAAPAGAQVHVDGQEIISARWLSPAQALAMQSQGTLLLVRPTINQLQQLAGFANTTELLDSNQGHDLRPVLPRLVGSGDQARMLLPGDPGYD